MSKSDVEMDDAEKLHDDSGNNIQESKSKLVDPKVDDSGNSIQESESKLVDPKVDDSGNNIQESECKLVDPKVDDSENNIQESECKLVDPKVDDSGNSIQEFECKVMDPKVQHKEEVPGATAASGDVNGRDQGGEDLNKCRDEDKDEMNVKTEVSDQTNPVNEASEPIEGSDCAIIITKSENKELINTETEPEVQTVATTAVEIQSDLKNEVAEPEATNYLVKENESTKNDVVDESHRENVERPIEDVLEKKPKEIGEVRKDTENTEHVAGEAMVENADSGTVSAENRQLSTEFSGNKDPQGRDAKLDDVRPGDDEEMEDAVHFDQDKMVRDEEQGVKTLPVNHEIDGNDKTLETAAKLDAEESSAVNQHEAATPFVRCSSAKATDHCGESSRVVFTQATLPMMGEDDDGTPEDQAAFMKELEHFYREKTMDFKPPKFYGQPLNCLKLWKAVIRLGGYDRVTGSKLWRQVGESFHPPKTCTTVSWTFRIFYEKSLLEYERHKTQSGELQLPIPMLPEVSGGDIEGNGHQGSGLGSGRARRDAASRAMQGWHVQRLVAGEVGDPIVKDKDLNNMAKNDKNLKSIGSLKQKRPNEVEHSSKAARTDVSKQLVTSVVDVGSPADWVKINVRQTKECFEVYALVPGLLREEVRVQSDPAGRLVITGQPEQVDNPWGITPFKKVISLPARIDPVNTSAVVSLHGRLLVRVPFEQPNI